MERIPAWAKWATQEWNEIQYNGVHYQPLEAGAPGVYEENKAYTFKYPRPSRYVPDWGRFAGQWRSQGGA